MSYFLQYESENGEVKQIAVEPRFLTPKLRVKIANFNKETQKQFKSLQKEFQEYEEYSKEINQKLVSRMKEAIEENPSMNEKEIEGLQSQLMMLIQADYPQDKAEQMEACSTKMQEYADSVNIKYFQMIVNKSKLKEDQRYLIEETPDSEFWQNADLQGVNDFILRFRDKYKV